MNRVTERKIFNWDAVTFTIKNYANVKFHIASCQMAQFGMPKRFVIVLPFPISRLLYLYKFPPCDEWFKKRFSFYSKIYFIRLSKFRLDPRTGIHLHFTTLIQCFRPHNIKMHRISNIFRQFYSTNLNFSIEWETHDKCSIGEYQFSSNGWSGSSSQGRRNSWPLSCNHLFDTASGKIHIFD